MPADDVTTWLAEYDGIPPDERIYPGRRRQVAPACAPHVPGEFVSAREAAALLGVSRSTFKDYVRGELPAVRIGRRVVFDRRDVEQWARERKVDGRCDSLRGEAGGRTSSGSVTLVGASKDQRVEAIRRKLLSKPRASTRR